jgi:hypothetical protein
MLFSEFCYYTWIKVLISNLVAVIQWSFDIIFEWMVTC